jgi:hypothetical protein
MRRTGVAAVAFIALTLCLFAVTGCRGTQFAQDDIGFFPPGTSYTTSWTQKAFWYAETGEAGSMYMRQEKDVWIRVEDRNGNRLLNDKMHFRCCQVVGKCTWVRFDTLNIELLEEGDATVGDPYSAALAKSGPRTIAKLTYRYNAPRGQFEHVR